MKDDNYEGIFGLMVICAIFVGLSYLAYVILIYISIRIYKKTSIPKRKEALLWFIYGCILITFYKIKSQPDNPEILFQLILFNYPISLITGCLIADFRNLFQLEVSNTGSLTINNQSNISNDNYNKYTPEPPQKKKNIFDVPPQD